MRDPDEMISWDDPNDVLVATLPIGFRMPDIERYTGVGCPRIHLRLIAQVISSKLGGLSTGFLRRYSFMVIRALHMESLSFLDRDQMSLFFFYLPWREEGLWSDIIPSPDTEGKELVDCLRAMEAYVPQTFSIDGLVIIPTRDHCRYLGVISHPYSIIILIQFSTIFYAFSYYHGHRTDYCASLRHTIQDLIDSGASLDSFSVVTGPRAEIDGMMVMIQSTLRLDSFKDELILLEYPSSSRGAPGIAMPSLLDLTSPASVTLGASHPRPRPHSVFQQHSLSISLATSTRLHPDIVDSGTFGHPQSDMFPIPTSAQAMHADSPSPAVPDLIDLGD
ncbi:hypothetical protein CK203_031945 [Vitis vinifera]|uniref:Uncharacterized protein n=1 Tax=Vitis vinifera TaxID=29760 RepID=A0A438IN58_VITVI|nr:hypothetical protein CK203_031945 [Vitis vinifera]